MSLGINTPYKPPKRRRNKPALFFAGLLILTLLLQAFLVNSLAGSNNSNQNVPLAQIDTETPTATNSATPTATPTLNPITLSFQNGVSPDNTYAGMKDTYISQANQFTSFWQSQSILVNGESAVGAADANYALMKWDISQIPIGSNILTASITFNVITPTTSFYPIYQLLKPWVDQQASWMNYAGGPSGTWEIPGALGPTDRGSLVLTGYSPQNPGLYQLNLNPGVVQEWVNSPTQNFGLIIADSVGSAPSTFDSAEATIATLRPKLTITYNWPAGTTPTPTYTPTFTSPAPVLPNPPTNLNATVFSASQINLGWTDNSTNETGFKIERSTDNVNFTEIAVTGPDITSYSNTGLTVNTIYYYRVRAFNDGGNSAFSNVASASTAPTATPTTPTPTVTGTPPTPTATGTIVPSLNVAKSVSPNQAQVGQLFNFAIQITNSGLAPALTSSLTDSFPTALTITGAQTSKGAYSINTSTNTITFTIGTINPNETVRVGILAQVNSTAVANTTFTNYATLNYAVGTVSQSRTSNSVSYRILGTSTLPPTGLGQDQAPGANTALRFVAILFTSLFIIIGITFLVVGRVRKTNESQWSGWLARTGLILIGAGLLFALASWGLSLPGKSGSVAAIPTPSAETTIQILNSEPDSLAFEMLLPTATPDRLPDFIIPTPSLHPSQDSDNIDSSPVEQIQIPALGLDTVVKYVPYDGFTWQIAGLKQEVAWMGDTSWPGLGKNTGLAGHVTLVDGSNGPFRYLADLHPGDIVVLYTQENVYTYTVQDQKVVEETDFSTLNNQTDKPQITLITCTNWDKDLKLYLNRLIVTANLDKVEPIKTANLGN